MKRIISLFLTVFLALALFAGCSMDYEQEDDTAESTGDVLTVWLCYDRNVPGSYYVFLWDDLEEEYGIEIEVKTYSRQEIKSKLKVAMACNELPDIFYVPGDSFAESLFESGLCVQVQDALTDAYFREEYIVPWEDGNNYVIPCAPSSYAAVYYNTELLELMDLTVPGTLDDLVELVWMVEAYNASNGTDYAAIELGMNDSWMGQLLYCVVAQSLDAEAYEALAAGESDLSADVLADAAEYIGDLVEMEAFPDNYAEIEEAEAVKDFINDNAVMMVHQTSLVYHLTQNMGADGFQMDTFPGCEGEEGAYLLDLNGSYSSGLAVSIESEYADEAVELCLEFAKRVNETNVVDYSYLSFLETSYSSPTYYSSNVDLLNEVTQNAEMISFFWGSLLPQDEADKWNTVMKKFYAGGLTADEMAEETGALVD